MARIWQLVTQEPEVGPGASPLGDLLGRLCTAAARDLPVTGCGVSLMSHADPLGTGASSDATSEALDELQFTVGEGPSVDAYAARHSILEPNLLAPAGQRWPLYAPAAVELGASAVFAFPLQLGASRLGALDLYRSTPGPLSPAVVTRALGFADVATDAVLTSQAAATQSSAPAGAELVIDHRAQLYHAQGMVMIQLEADLTTAMVRMRAHAYSHGRPIGDVASDIATGRLRLDADPAR